MKTIWKYPIIVGAGRFTIDVPIGAIARHAGLDPQGQPCLWFEVDPESTETICVVHIVGTDHDVPEGTAYLASFIQGPFVWHIYLGKP